MLLYALPTWTPKAEYSLNDGNKKEKKEQEAWKKKKKKVVDNLAMVDRALLSTFFFFFWGEPDQWLVHYSFSSDTSF